MYIKGSNAVIAWSENIGNQRFIFSLTGAECYAINILRGGKKQRGL